ncbi:LysR family transcriptional regulator [Gluconobacter japonicus]|uniref:LysR family transcriptional regulator n=1 Tax=Gluconobacter japonicus TaxID=376620 RepID=A0A9Q2FN85_GLUJA|nr:LysR family transcriptional regulator [Gluconobacter japonicus]MBF0872026.1 LysR family transcriptional regulator [Gluconobacter japonicus]
MEDVVTLEQLRIFIEVAIREHVTAAAKALNITQSTASAAIAALEDRHGIKLFHRVGRGISLTEAGRVFLVEARNVLASAAVAEATLDDLSGLSRGSLRVVASQTIAAYWLPSALVAFRQTFPDISIVLEVGNTRQAAEHVRKGHSDLGIVEGIVDDPALAHWPVGEDRLQIVRSTPFQNTTVDAVWLQNAPWIMREKGSGTRSSLNQALQARSINPDMLKEVLALPSNESVRTAVEAGAGVAALSSLVVAPSLVSQTLYAAPVDLGPRIFFGLRHKERYRSKAADAFLHILETHKKNPAPKT